MKLLNCVGIGCDRCGKPSRDEFTYYSFDFKLIEVITGRAKMAADSLPVIYSLDCCALCMKEIGELAIKNYKSSIAAITCDLCGSSMSGTFSFYHCTVTEAKVSLAAGSFQCRNCKTFLSAPDKPCTKCGLIAVTRIAEVLADDKYLQISVCENDYKQLVDTAVGLRQKAGAQAT